MITTSTNKDNFFKNTSTVFTPVTDIDFRADYKSYSGSEYMFTDRGVYRKANHWGSVASCCWLLSEGGKVSLDIGGNGVHHTDEIVGFSRWEKFDEVMRLGLKLREGMLKLDEFLQKISE